MNLRIQELATTAGISLEYLTNTKQITTLEEFAELIVQECIWALWTEECRTSDLASEEYTRGSNKIKEHFGIEP